MVDVLTARDQLIDAFIAGSDFAGAQRTKIPGDASTRRYERLTHHGRHYILMDVPPVETPICTPGMSDAERIALGDNAKRRLAASRVDAFVCITDWLRGQGFSAPQIFAASAKDGIAILEDFGGGQYWAQLQKDQTDEAEMYRAATDALVKLSQLTPPDAVTWEGESWPLLAYDRLAMQSEANLLPEWYAGRHCGVAIDETAIASYETAWHDLLSVFDNAPRRLILRDYHSPNLMWLPDRAGLNRAGMLDYQDAVIGHPAYDMMFLLNDARRDVPPAIQTEMLDRYLGAAGIDRAAFMAAYSAYQALNNVRIAGVFCRLNYRDNKPNYMQHLPRVLRYVAASLQHPACAPLKAWFDRYLPDFAQKAAA